MVSFHHTCMDALKVCRLRVDYGLIGVAVDWSGGGRPTGGGGRLVKTMAEDATERLSELFAHDAVEQEVNGAVDEHDDVPDVAERDVHLVEDRIVEAAEECQHALR